MTDERLMDYEYMDDGCLMDVESMMIEWWMTHGYMINQVWMNDG
jgi:hypothetical protein